MPSLEKKYLHDIDLSTNKLLNARMHPVTTAQRLALGSGYNSGDAGVLVYDLDEIVYYGWDGNQWIQCSLTPLQLIQLQQAFDNIVTGVSISDTNTTRTVTLTKLNAPSVSDTYQRAYIHNQTSPAAIWTITHSLNKYPSVSIVDSAYQEVIGEVEYLTPNTLEVRFTAPFSGQAFIN